MKVRDIMTVEPSCCAVSDDLALVTSALFEKDCGALPVLSPDGTVVGMITDRDVAIASATRNRTPSLIVVAEVISGTLHFCGPEDDLEDALETMSLNQVRRLPVLHPDGRVAGLLSVNDVIRHAAKAPASGSIRRQALEAASRIGSPVRRPEEGSDDSSLGPAARRSPVKRATRSASRGKVPAKAKGKGKV